MTNNRFLEYCVTGFKDLFSYISCSMKLRMRTKLNLHLLTDFETVELIKNKGYSLARFGDGEFRWMQNIEGRCDFQDTSTDLQKKLLDSFNSKKENLLIGVPKPLLDDRECVFYSRKYWRQYVLENYGWLKGVLNPNLFYANTNITRPYMDYLDKKKALAAFTQIKTIWDQRDVLVCEGKKTKFGVGNDLLNNARSVKRIICPEKNAFSKYNEICSAIFKFGDENNLILLCLGPTATILASDINLSKYQLVDIGHLDIEYEWFLRQAKSKIPVPGKFVNEAHYQGDRKFEEDQRYLKSIIFEVA